MNLLKKKNACAFDGFLFSVASRYSISKPILQCFPKLRAQAPIYNVPAVVEN